MLRAIFIIVFLLLIQHDLPAQVMMNLDSLLRLIPAAKEDSAAVDLYINIGQQYELNEPEKSKFYYRKARDLSEKINYPAGVIKYINNYTYVLNVEGNTDSSLLLNLYGVELSRKTNDSLNLAKTLFNTGTSYRFMNEYEKAIPYYMEGYAIFERIGNADLVTKTYDILQVIHQDLKQYPKALEYGKKAVEKSKEINNPLFLGTAYLNLGISYFKMGDYQEARTLFEQAMAIGKQLNNQQLISSSLLGIGSYHIHTAEYEKLDGIYEQSLKIGRQTQDRETEITSLTGLSIYQLSQNNYTKARDIAMEALQLSEKYGFKKERLEAYEQLSKIYYGLRDMRTAESFAAKAELLSDSLINENIQKITVDAEKKYETAKKQAQINQLTAEKKVQELSIQRKNIINIIVILSALAMGVIFLLSWRNYKHRQSIQQQRITELESEKQLAATEAVLKGEEKERTRLAKDLHDGLGGMLSGIKFTMNNMKGNLIMTEENQLAFERSMDMLDSSIREMRRVAHNLMPEALVKFGLDTAISDFCNDIRRSGALNIQYQSVGMENVQLEQTTAITIYRIVQELVNNIIKHAAAHSAVVQITKTEDIIAITVEDDGKGFDTAVLKGTKGIGWSNIQNRVEFMKGRLDVKTEPDNGTSVHIVIDA
jgi:two-component system, NarL family, sensor kinase